MDFYASQVLFARKLLSGEAHAQDIVQDIFIKVLESQTEFSNEIAFKSYLYISTRNACIDYLRRKNKILGDVSLLGNVEAEATEVMKEEAFYLLEQAITTLPAQSRRIFELTLQGLSIHDIAAELHISENTVKTLKQRAYKALRNRFGDFFMLIAFLFFQS